MRILFCIIISLLIFSGQLQANVVFEDGQWHTINYTINDNVIVDYDKPGVGTTVEVVNGGWIKNGIAAYSDSHLIIRGGIVDQGVLSTSYVSIYGGNISGISTGSHSNIEIFDGTILGQFDLDVYSRGHIYGGSIGFGISANGSSHLNIDDGSIGNLRSTSEGLIFVNGGTINGDVITRNNSLITFKGEDFLVNGNLIQYGQSARLYGISGVNQYGQQYFGGNITGILSNGDLLNVSFYIYDNSDITFVPEPATILLLSLGIVFLRKRKYKIY